MEGRKDKARKKRRRKLILVITVVGIGICLCICLMAVNRSSTRSIVPTITALPPTTIPSTAPMPIPTPSLAPTRMSTTTTVLPIVEAGEHGLNIRVGPGTNYPILVYVDPGTQLVVVGRYLNWFQVDFNGTLAWVSGDVVTAYNVRGVKHVVPPPSPIPTLIPSLSPVPTLIPSSTPGLLLPSPSPSSIPSPTPILVIEPTQQPATCDCSGNVYNCGDFTTHVKAQACYQYCKSLGLGDVHELDKNNDGSACESLP